MAQWLILLFVCLFAQPVSAEWYLGGQIGGVFPNTIGQADVSGAGIPGGSRFTNVDLNSSIMYGAKAGYYFERRGLEWLGLETEAYNATPHIPQQQVGLSVPPVSVQGILTGARLRVLTWAPVIVKARYQAGNWQPYAGVGMGVFFAKTNALGTSTSDTAPGLVTQLGVEYKLTDRLGLFGEWKYNHTNLSFTDSGVTVKADYNAHVLAFGLNFHLPQ